MYSKSIVSIALISLLLSLGAHAQDQEDQVVTIYFGGTLMDSTMWRESSSTFSRPETVATLYQLQVASPMYANHHKGFVDGFLGLEAAFADWTMNFHKAYDILIPVTSLCEGECITLNLVGFSRGAVSTMHMAHQIETNILFQELRGQIKKINILVFDPVPGDPSLAGENFNLTSRVEFLGFYARDERSLAFSPVFPKYTAGGRPVNFFTVPGSHETMVGSTRLNGHWPYLWPFDSLNGLDTANLDHVSRTLKIVATEILGSSDWGHVRFGTHPDPNVTLNLDWYDGETDIGTLQQRFIEDNLDPIYSPSLPTDLYRNMRRFSFILGLEAWDQLLGLGCQPALDLTLVTPDNPRCVYYQPNGYAGALVFSDAPLTAVAGARPLNNQIGFEYELWNLIVTNGALDVDADFVDFSDDNCPVEPNTDQADFDFDLIGDACDTCTDTDVDGAGDPGFPNNTCAVDNCPRVSNVDQKNLDGDSFGDACDLDDDNDGIFDIIDPCPNEPAPLGCPLPLSVTQGGGSTGPVLLVALLLIILSSHRRDRQP